MLKIPIDLVTGFIGSGKTTWIKFLLQFTTVPHEKVMVLQLEKGQEDLGAFQLQKGNMKYFIKTDEGLHEGYLKNLITLYEPDRIIMECNGMQSIEEVFKLIETSQLRRYAFINTIFHLAEGPQFQVYWQNLRAILEPSLKLSHMIVVTKTHLIPLGEEEKLRELLEGANKTAHILFAGELVHMEETVKACKLLDKGWSKAVKIKWVKKIKKLWMNKGEKR